MFKKNKKFEVSILDNNRSDSKIQMESDVGFRLSFLLKNPFLIIKKPKVIFLPDDLKKKITKERDLSMFRIWILFFCIFIIGFCVFISFLIIRNVLPNNDPNANVNYHTPQKYIDTFNNYIKNSNILSKRRQKNDDTYTINNSYFKQNGFGKLNKMVLTFNPDYYGYDTYDSIKKEYNVFVDLVNSRTYSADHINFKNNKNYLEPTLDISVVLSGKPIIKIKKINGDIIYNLNVIGNYFSNSSQAVYWRPKTVKTSNINVGTNTFNNFSYSKITSFYISACGPFSSLWPTGSIPPSDLFKDKFFRASGNLSNIFIRGRFSIPLGTGENGIDFFNFKKWQALTFNNILTIRSSYDNGNYGVKMGLGKYKAGIYSLNKDLYVIWFVGWNFKENKQVSVILPNSENNIMINLSIL